MNETNELFLHFSDEQIAVCEKPAGLLSEGEGKDSLPSLLASQLGGEIYPVHRLDRETSGLMVFARTKSAAAQLSRELTDGSLQKEYLALLCGVPQEKQARLSDLLFYDRRAGKSFVVRKERKGVKLAELDYEVLAEEQGRSLVRVALLTGRTHQIRVQFASRKLPLVGDRRYGAPADGASIALHSFHLRFTHPKTGEPMEFFSAPTREEFLPFANHFPIEKNDKV